MPNKDKNIPKRRFKSFENADAWELRKLGEVVYRSNLTSSCKDLPRLEFEDINSGLGTLNKDISQKVDDRKGLEFNEGDVLFGKLRPYLKNWWYAEFKGIALGDFWNLKSDLWHSCFLYTYIQSNSFQLVANDTSGTKMPRSDWNLVAESIAKFPSLPEQEAIGTFFSTLDRHITLHQRKLDKLKSVKQAYLSEMFPAEGERVPKRRFPGFTD
ncbi:TPA: restriction endonuclease subunit S, partial [Streptococcus suis]|nr:restriction endonuclease subunit S [Streptococcus suis]